MRLGQRLTSVEDYAPFDDYTLDRMWMEQGYYLPAHAYGSCPAHCPLCRKEREE